MSYYMYRAGGDANYPLANVNTADLEGVMWYLHNEVVTSAPRKYGIDRIRRFMVTVKNTQEFYNVHKKQFGPFLAYDAAQCTTKNNGQNTCDQVYNMYGFIVGCQSVSPDKAAYQAKVPTNTNCAAGTAQCYQPLWYSLPGECPSMGIPQDSIDANQADQDVGQYKTADCKYRNPGGKCSSPTGAPDCTYSVQPAGEIYLDDLAGIPDYQFFWNTSFENCNLELQSGARTQPCVKHYEYVEAYDQGVGNTFWNSRLDAAECNRRVEAALALFASKYPDLPKSLPPPLCDFDTIYANEWTWQPNHTAAVQSQWWTYRQAR